MPKFTSIKSFLTNRRRSVSGTGEEATTEIAADDDGKGHTVVTTSVLTADNSTGDETIASVDTRLMEYEEIESLREQDPFMYHSIVQQQRRSNRSILSLDDDNGRISAAQFDQYEDAASARSSMTSSVARSIMVLALEDFGDDEDEEGETATPNHADGADDGAGVPVQVATLQQLLPAPDRRQARRRSQSMHPTRTPALPQRQQRRFSQSFSEFTTGVVRRQRRVSTECHPSLIIADPELFSSLRDSHMSSSMRIDILFDDQDMFDLGDEELDVLFSD